MNRHDVDAYARRLLDDARSANVSTHMRYSAACRALAALLDAGCGSVNNSVTVTRGGNVRYAGAQVPVPACRHRLRPMLRPSSRVFSRCWMRPNDALAP